MDRKYFFSRAENQVKEIDQLTESYTRHSVNNLLPFLKFIQENLHGIHRWKKVKAKNLPEELVAPLALNLARAEMMAYLKGRLHILDDIKTSKLEFIDITAEPVLPEEAIRFFESKIPMTRAEFDTLAEVFKGRAFTIAYVTELDLIQSVKDELKKALEQGMTLREFRANLTDLFTRRGYTSLNPYHIETVFRTNLLQAYNAGRFEQSLRAPGVYLLEYMAIMDDRTSDICRHLDGIRKPPGDPFWQTHYPPNHFNCRSVVRPITAAEARIEGIRMTRRVPDVMPQEGFRSNPLLSRLPRQYIDRAHRYGIDTSHLEASLKELMDRYSVEQSISEILQRAYFTRQEFKKEFLRKILPQFKQVLFRDKDLRTAFNRELTGALNRVKIFRDSTKHYLGRMNPNTREIELNMVSLTNWSVLAHELGHWWHFYYNFASNRGIHPQILRMFRGEAKRLANALRRANIPASKHYLITMLESPYFRGIGDDYYILDRLIRTYNLSGFLEGYAFKNVYEFVAESFEAMSGGKLAIIGELSPELEEIFRTLRGLIRSI